jgi:hypothetical protein
VFGVKSPHASADACVAALGVAGFVEERRGELNGVVKLCSAEHATFELGEASYSASPSSATQNYKAWSQLTKSVVKRLARWRGCAIGTTHSVGSLIS